MSSASFRATLPGSTLTRIFAQCPVPTGIAIVLLLLGPVSAVAQQVDTMVVRLAPITVEAERYSQELAAATSAISRLELETVEGMPSDNATDLFRMLPGLGFLSLDGTGHDAQAVVRGFFGGGDAEYVQVLIDGVPVNDIESGLVAWDLINLHAISRAEVLRGGSSSLYGDAAIGGVLNLHTDRSPGRKMSGSVHYGSHATIEAAARYADQIGMRRFSVGGMVDRSDGYRERGDREVAAVHLEGDLLADGPVRGRVSLSSAWRDVSKPGPLTDSLFAVSRQSVSPMFAADRIDERRHSGSLLFESATDGPLTWRARARSALRDARDISTLALAADFADTQDRDLLTRSLGVEGQVIGRGAFGQLVAGVDVAFNGLESTYYQFFTGTSADYENAGPLTRGDELVSGDGSRRQLGAFVQAESKRFGPLAITAGARLDQIADRYTPDGDAEVENTHNAFSPKVGLNVEVLNSPDARVNLYVSAGQSFKAPAIDQLFDQRMTPVPFPPFAIAISNGELDPQRGDNLELGGYGQVLVPGRGRVEASLSLYRMDMRDELDFSFAEFRLINIGKSRHEGAEVGARYFDRSGVTAHVSYAYQSTTFRNGDNEGNYVKAVPRDLIDAGVSYAHTSGIGAGLRYSGARRIFLDDQNTRGLKDSDRLDAQLSFTKADATVMIEVFNLLDEANVSTGFPDPAGGDGRFLYPTAERYIKLGVIYRR